MNHMLEALARAIAEAGIQLTPTHNSVLAAIEFDAGSVDNTEAPISQEIANKIANGIISKLEGYQKLHLPLARKLTEDVSVLVAENKPVLDVNKTKVTVFDYPLILDELRSKEKIPESMVPVPKLEVSTLQVTLDTDSLYERVSFENVLLNKLLNQYKVKYTPVELDKLLSPYIESISVSNDNLLNLSYAKINNFEKVLFMYALTTNLVEKPVQASVSASKYLEQMTILERMLRNSLTSYYLKLQLLRRNNTLIVGSANKEIIVFKPVYHTYLDNGRCVESLLGYVSSDDFRIGETISLSLFEEKAEYYKNKYNEVVKRQKLMNSVSIPKQYRHMFVLATKKLVDNYNKTNETPIPFEKYELETIVGAYINDVTNDEIIDIEKISYDIIADVILEDAEFNYFAESMFMQQKLNPDIQPQEAATVVAIQMVAKYIISQIRSVKLT